MMNGVVYSLADSNEIVCVFTKYDKPYRKINVPEFAGISETPLTGEACLSLPQQTWTFAPYYPMEQEVGLEGVTFVHYHKGLEV